MSHYERRLEADVERIREEVREVSERIQRALDDSVRALLSGDRDLTNATILGDLQINREIRDIDHLCLVFVNRHLPTAGHLRFVSAVRRLIIGLERIGDYAVTIGRATIQLSQPPPGTLMRDIEMMADHSRLILAQSMESFNQENADSAKAILTLAGQMDSTFHRALSDLIREGEKGSRPVGDIVALQTIFNRLERVNDQAKNICEETIFAVTGETKPQKVYRILFIDERDDCLTKIAEALARVEYPESGRYASAGWNPAESMDEACRRLLDLHGLDLDTYAPTQLRAVHEVLDDYHVIVGVGANPLEHIPDLPFHTVLLHWPLEVDGQAAAMETLRKYVRQLMETLRGPKAG